MKKSQILTKEYFDQQLGKVFEEKLEKKLDEKLKGFVTKEYFDLQLGKVLDEKFNDFALLLKGNFDYIYENMATKKDIQELTSRLLSLEDTIINDHRPRIRDLEKSMGFHD